jgi:lipopolysaccharide export system protein LptC
MIARDRYSRAIGLLKVAFPLAALALLSTLFLVARAMNPDTPVPFAEKEIEERLRDQQITGPFFSGTTTGGDQMSFSAQKLITLRDRIGVNRAEDVSASLETAQGAKFQLQSDVAELDIAGNLAELSGHVSMMTSTGYQIISDRITTSISVMDLTAMGDVQATGPPGTLTAGKMRVFSTKETDSTQMLFSDGVKLVYTP